MLKSRGILGVAYSPDGKTLATASSDRTAALWDADTGDQTFLLRGHREDVNCVSFSPDSQRVITGSSEDFSIIWDATTGRRIMRGGRHSNNIHSAVFTPDGQRFISGEREQLVMMWDATTGELARTFVGHSAEIFTIIASPDGRTALTASRDGTARLWDLATGRELLTLTTDGSRQSWVVASPDGLFDGTDAGRRALGFRFTRFGAEIENFFADGYHPGLLAKLWRGERPFPAKALGRDKPPIVKVAAPKGRVVKEPTASLSAEVTDQGGGIADLVIENNGVRLAVPTKSERVDDKLTRFAFTVPLVPGANSIRVRSACRDGSWESAAAGIDLTHPRTQGQKGRMYVVAVGISSHGEKKLTLDHPAKDVKALAELLQARGEKLFDRVDVVPVYDRDATRATIEDTLKDVAELTLPQDTIAVIMCGHGARVGDRVHFAPHDLRIGDDRPHDALQKRGVAIDDVAAVLGSARALNRVLVADASTSAELFGDGQKDLSEFGFRGAVERWGRSYGIHALVAVTPAGGQVNGRGVLADSLMQVAGRTTLDVSNWFLTAADRATASPRKRNGLRQYFSASTRLRSFPILAANQ
jgi:hypothetical protein